MSEKQYKTTNIVLKNKDHKLLQYCFENAQLAKLFRNAVIYRCRQLYFAYRKSYQNLTQQEHSLALTKGLNMTDRARQRRMPMADRIAARA